MFELVEGFLNLRYLSFKDGYIKFGDEKMLFVNLFPLVEQAYITFRNPNISSSLAFYLAFKQSSYNFTKEHFFKFGKRIENVAEMSKKFFYFLGWGDFEFEKVSQKNNFLIISGKKSSFAEEYKRLHGPQLKPVDIMIAGIFAGSVQAYSSGVSIQCIEAACKAQKDSEACYFVASTQENIISYLKKFYPNQLFTAKQFLKRASTEEKRLKLRFE